MVLQETHSKAETDMVVWLGKDEDYLSVFGLLTTCFQIYNDQNCERRNEKWQTAVIEFRSFLRNRLNLCLDLESLSQFKVVFQVKAYR